MSQTPTEELRLRATEEQMRRALGLRQGSSSSARFSSSGTHAPHPQKRQFVRDGDVPVEILHGHDNSSRVNQLAATREALQAQTAAREEAERLLTEARHTIHDLETKLGHERLAKDEATQRTNAARLQIEEALTAAREELAVERALRARAERERDEAAVARQTPEQRLRQTTAPPKIRAGSALPSGATAQRRRGRPPKVAPEVTPDASDIVEWWSPGWKDKYR